MSTAVPTSVRYWAPGVSIARWIPTIANSSLKPGAAGYLEPTYIEWDAGIDLTPEVADLSGFNISAEQLPTPGLTAFTGSVPGPLTVDASSLTFYGSNDGQDVRTVLTRNQSGFLAIGDAGEAEGDLIDIFPARVASIGKIRGVSVREAFRLMVPFSITRQPIEDFAIPAAA